ncbi:hypothetical protein [Tautonia sociabilis]|uniref:Peptidase C-terminal archaeal/bacterial domain-containing protein n=1 Tax=Tautonia sociabilis TaxID=2080755 RepID=A0A432MK30_9BACT|nr:hypothetical protein [Tautonia sociabilis]RUL87557.1 hypothetical protein TsocGM_12030 [Tautonia sociabilis]
MPRASTRSHRSRIRTALPAMLAVVLFPSLGLAQPGDWTPGVYMTQAMGRVMGAVRAISDKSDYGYDGPNTVCFMGGYFRPGATIGFNRHLERGRPYAFIGGGDEDAVDVDIEIFDEAGNLVAEDTKTDAEPTILYTPPRSGTYTIEVTLYDAPESCFCALAVLRQGGIDVPTENVVEATTKLIRHCLTIVDRVETAGFNTEENQWAVWGAVYEQGQQITVDNVKLAKGVNVFIAAGDTQTIDIDVHLRNERDTLLVEDVLEDAEPRVVYEVGGGSGTYQVATTNASSRGPTLIMTAALLAK